MYVILIYDISIEAGGQKVSSKTFKTCKKYLSHIQKSTFEGEITKSQIMSLKFELSKFIRKDLDSVILFKTRQEKWLEKDFSVI